MDIELYDKPAYSLEDYHNMRCHNRECFKENPEAYCTLQYDFPILYEVSVDGTVYYLKDFWEGLGWLRKHYRVPIKRYSKYSDVFSHKSMRLPANIDYFNRYEENEFNYSMHHISKTNMFRYILLSSSHKIELYKGTEKEAEELFERFYK